MRSLTVALAAILAVLLVCIVFTLSERGVLVELQKLGQAPIESPEQREIMNSVSLGAEWFIQSENETFIHYYYDMNSGEYALETNSIRELASLWSIEKSGKFLNNSRLLMLGDKGTAYFEKYLYSDATEDYMVVSLPQDRKTIAHSALFVLALSEGNNPKKELYLEKLGKGMLSLQRFDGSFNTLFYSKSDFGYGMPSIDYYPGEALLAIMTLYENTHNEIYLESAEKAFPYYRTYWRQNKNLAFVPWHSQAYEKAYFSTGKKEYREFVFEMNDYILEEYSPKEECRNFSFTRGIATAPHMEGVISAYNLAISSGDKKRASCYKNFILESSVYIRSLQANGPEVDIEALGGFRSNPKSPILRIDNTQHSLLGFIRAYESGVYN